MSTISSVPSNQLFTTTQAGSSGDSTSTGKTASTSTAVDKTTGQALLQSTSPKMPQITEILGMLKKVLEAVTSLMELFGKEKDSSSLKGGSSSKGTGAGVSSQHCGVTQRKSLHTDSTLQAGSTLQKSGEFLWKPQSDKDGKLAILLPSALEGTVDSVSVVSPNGSIEKGKYAGVGNGSREHFRFSKSGGDFPDGSRVIITMKDGSLKEVAISDSRARYQM